MQKKWLELALPIAIVLCIFVIYLPVPTGLMDLMLAANITLAVVLLLSAVFARSPLELSVFPALLLVTTLGRLALNVATTRLILTRGPIDKELAAGEVVRAFGEFVTGDNLLVGIIIFAILFIVQFVVITKGATRIGEVSARFALDGLPGRQMAIDADLNSGMIDLEEAQRRRRELLRQADFHGAMDGASKYVRGDAIAGLLITFINIAAGLGLGLYHNMSLIESTTTFTKLTIGDGLVTQLPALLISIAAALLVSRGSDESNLPRESILQLFSNPYVLAIASGLMALLSFTELPQAPLLTISLVTGALAFYKFRQPQFSGLGPEGPVKATPATELPIEKLLEIDSLEVQLGGDLIGLADARQGGTLIAEIGNMRKRLATQLGIALPKVRVRDNLSLPANQFEVFLQGHNVIRSHVSLDRLLVTNWTGRVPDDGVPAQGMAWVKDGIWVDAALAIRSQTNRCLTPAQVVAESVFWVGRVHATELLTRDAVQQLIDELKKTAPAIVAELIPNAMSLARLQKILQTLVHEGISIRPLGLICETLADSVPADLTDAELIERTRLRLSRQITERVRTPGNIIRCFGIASDVSAKLKLSLGRPIGKTDKARTNGLAEPFSTNLIKAVSAGVRHMNSLNVPAVLKVDQTLRPMIAELVQHLLPELMVLGDGEIDRECTCEVIAEIRMSDLQSEVQAA